MYTKLFFDNWIFLTISTNYKHLKSKTLLKHELKSIYFQVNKSFLFITIVHSFISWNEHPGNSACPIIEQTSPSISETKLLPTLFFHTDLHVTEEYFK